VFVVEMLRCLDRLNEVRDEIDSGKTAMANRFGLIELETALRGQFEKMLRRSRLAYDPMIDGVLGGLKGK
jgi:hypothetical protein